MSSPLKIDAPPLTFDQLARQHGVTAARKNEILELARELLAKPRGAVRFRSKQQQARETGKRKVV